MQALGSNVTTPPDAALPGGLIPNSTRELDWFDIGKTRRVHWNRPIAVQTWSRYCYFQGLDLRFSTVAAGVRQVRSRRYRVLRFHDRL